MNINHTESTAFTPKLGKFFESLSPLLQKIKQKENPDLGFSLDLPLLKSWFEKLEVPLTNSRRGGFGFNPWLVANLKRDEVRNSSVLTWLLDPLGSHGLGSLALNAMLRVTTNDLRFDLSDLQFCSVKQETNPEGDTKNRVDIEIECEKFYLLVEVKIDAKESKNQLQNYAEICKRRANKRPWLIIFLTPNKSTSKSAGEHHGKVLSISWSELSTSISQALKDLIKSQNGMINGRQEILVQESVKQFLTHVYSFNKRKN